MAPADDAARSRTSEVARVIGFSPRTIARWASEKRTILVLMMPSAYSRARPAEGDGDVKVDGRRA